MPVTDRLFTRRRTSAPPSSPPSPSKLAFNSPRRSISSSTSFHTAKTTVPESEPEPVSASVSVATSSALTQPASSPAIPTVSTLPLLPPLPPPARPSAGSTVLNAYPSSRSSVRARWPFSSSSKATSSASTPPTSPRPKRPRSRHERRSAATSVAASSARNIASVTFDIRRGRNQYPPSEISSQSSVDGGRRSSRTSRPPRLPTTARSSEVGSSSSLHLQPSSVPLLARAKSASTQSRSRNQALSSQQPPTKSTPVSPKTSPSPLAAPSTPSFTPTLPPAPMHSSSPTSTSAVPPPDDWGLDELTDDDGPVPVISTPARRSSGRVPDLSSGDVGDEITAVDEPSSLREGPTEPHHITNTDALTLRAYDDTPQRHTSAPTELSTVGNVIGVYADPAAETDDWGDDFVLDNVSAELDSSSSKPPDLPSPQPPWPESSRFDVVTTGHTRRSSNPALPPLFPGPGRSAAVEVQPLPDDSLPIRAAPSVAFQAPTLTYSSLLMYPDVGYQASTVHPNCAKVLEFFASHSTSIRKHFDALVRDSGGTIAFDENTRRAYLFSRDPDVATLSNENTDLSAEVLSWKFEWATLINAHTERSRLLLALSKLHKDVGNFEHAKFVVRDALNILAAVEPSPLTTIIATELEYEMAILHRADGALAEAGRSLMRAMTHSVTLTNYTEFEPRVPAAQQRGFWWLLRCKYLRAEIAYDLEERDTAVQFYSEYIFDSVSRMIGATPPPSRVQGQLGPEYMRFCLFSPRRLVLALWVSALCLGEMRCFGAAADMANLTTLAASAFGYEDANEAAAYSRSRIKEIATELRQQYDTVSRTIVLRKETDADNLGVSSVANISQMASNSFNYGSQDFGREMEENVVEDWDAQLERELNVTIQRCCDVDAEDSNSIGASPTQSDLPFDSVLQPESGHVPASGQHSAEGQEFNRSVNQPGRNRRSEAHGQQSRWHRGTREGQLIEAELRQYLQRLIGQAATLPSRLMFPRPTEPFEGPLMGPREHEQFLRTFVRSKDPEWCWRSRHGLTLTSQWHPSAVCKLNFNIEPIEDIDTFNFGIDILSLSLGTRLLESVWKVVRSQVSIHTKQSRVRRLILNAFSKVAASAKRSPTRDETDRRERLEMLGAMLDALRLAREVVTDSGKEAVWFSRACMFLGTAAATVTPTVKAAVELFQAESRAHCGVHAVVPLKMIQKVAKFAEERVGREEFFAKSNVADEAVERRSDIPSSLRQTVVDLMHALYWRTKAGFDESSASNSLERLLHADVASSLFLTGCGISPVDGSPIDLVKEIQALRIPKRRRTKSIDSETVVDETRRVSSSELVDELQMLWTSLPFTAGTIRAKISFALAHHARVSEKNYPRAERFLFDGLQSLHAVSGGGSYPRSFFSPVISISPVSIVSSPLAGAILTGYSDLTSSHSKYRYSIAAREATCDAARVRNEGKQMYRAAIFEVVDLALSNNDWRRALSLLYNLRPLVHPKDGLRNEFLRVCIMMHDVCRRAGCLEASIVPLRAFSALIYEERLRVLLQRYKRRLAKKKKHRIQRYFSSSPLPRLLPGSSAFSTKKNALASFFEVPVMTAAIDSTFRQSVGLFDSGPFSDSRRGTLTPTSESPSPSIGFLHRFFSVILPLHLLLLPRASPRRARSSSENRQSHPVEDPMDDPSESLPPPLGDSNNSVRLGNNPRQSAQESSIAQLDNSNREFEQEQRELLRIEAEQEVAADSDRCKVEFLRIETDYANADYQAAEERCCGLLEMSIPMETRCRVLEVMARIRLKRREITRCLETVDNLENACHAVEGDLFSVGRTGHDETSRLSLFRFSDQDRPPRNEKSTPRFIASVTFLRLRALTYGGRLHEALRLADRALELCTESSFWNQGRVHYLRGKILYRMSNTSAPVYQAEEDVVAGKSEDELESGMTMKLTELTLTAFENSSQYFDAAGDELSAAKSDFHWARTCIDYLFRKVVLSEGSGGGVPLNVACKLVTRRILMSEVQQVVYNVLNLSSHASIPLLFIDSMIALAEVKCICGHPNSTWLSWVMEGWKLFSRLFANTEDMTVVLSSLAPVSTLMRLRNICGRLVRLLMCNDNVVASAEMNRHLRVFEAYVKLHLSIDLKMNLSSSAHSRVRRNSEPDSGKENVNPKTQFEETRNTPKSFSRSTSNRETRRISNASARSVPMVNLRDSSGTREKRHTRTAIDPESVPTSNNRARPAGAFLHLLGNEGIALGRRGITMFLDRPHKQVMSAVKGTGAVFIPTNFFSNSIAPGIASNKLGKDAELIFPFQPSVGLGAMQILDSEFKRYDDRTSLTFNTHPFSEGGRSRVIKGTAADPLTLKRLLDDEITITESNTSLFHTSDSDARRPEDLDKVELGEEVSEATVAEGWRKSTRFPGRATSFKNVQSPAPVNDDNLKLCDNELAALVKTITTELENSKVEMTGRSPLYGKSIAERVWAHMHRIKSEAKLYMHGRISMQQLHERNFEALQSWMQCIPVSSKEWVVPESIGRRLVYILLAHGVVGYYAVERGGSVAQVSFGGKQCFRSMTEDREASGLSTPGPRPPSSAEQRYLAEIVTGFKSYEVWQKERDTEIVNGLANHVLRAPRLLLTTSSPAHKSRSRPIVLVTDLSLQVLPWELFFDHVVIRTHCLLDVIRGSQIGASSFSGTMEIDDPVIAATRPVVKYFNFVPSRKEAADIERTEEARRQQLAFQGLLRLNHKNPTSLISFLGLGGFSDPTAVNAMARPTGPLSSPLTQFRNGLQLMGVRVAIANIGKRNFPHLDFVKVSGLGSATTRDLKEAAFNLNSNLEARNLDRGHRDIGAYIPVFMFSYAELVDSSECVFGLRREIPSGILMFTPAVHMKVLAKHLQDEELSAEVARASGRLQNRIFPDVIGAARVVVEHVSRFSRAKRIPIVVYLGDGLMDIFSGRRPASRALGERKAAPAAERIVHLSSGGRMEFLRQ